MTEDERLMEHNLSLYIDTYHFILEDVGKIFSQFLRVYYFDVAVSCLNYLP
jgi:hypothetical protein